MFRASQHDVTQCGASRAMNFIHRTVAIIGIATVLGGTSQVVRAQPPQTLISQTNAVEFFNQGVDKAQKGNYQGAIEDFNKALQLNPKLIEGYCNRGLARIGLGDIEAAIGDFNLALGIDPNHADAYHKRGNAYAQKGNLQRAVVDFDQAVRLDSKNADAYYNRGIARTELGNLQGALSDYNQVIRLNPTLAEAHGNRGFVRYRLGDKPGALTDLHKAAQLFSDQGNTSGYQQALNSIKMVQQSPTPKFSPKEPPRPEYW